MQEDNTKFETETTRCSWPGTDSLQLKYHDTEWGVPVHDDAKQFEFLTLEAFQSGLSWNLILKRRENFRQAFDGFVPSKVAKYGEKERSALLNNQGIIRNRAKIDATINNADAFCKLADREGSFSSWIWRFVDNKPVINNFPECNIPSTTPLSIQIAKELKAEGFKFLGPTVVYSHMQATGMAMDHAPSCFRYSELVA